MRRGDYVGPPLHDLPLHHRLRDLWLVWRHCQRVEVFASISCTFARRPQIFLVFNCQTAKKLSIPQRPLNPSPPQTPAKQFLSTAEKAATAFLQSGTF